LTSLIAGRGSRLAFLLVGVLLAAAPAFALEPDQIALVVNSRVPVGRVLAELYARERHIPDGRIIELSLDPGSSISPSEDISFDAYDTQVVAPVRSFLSTHNLQNRVTCLVTFWGVPLRIDRKPLTPLIKQETDQIGKELAETRTAVIKELTALEQSAAKDDPTFKPQPGDDLPHLARRFDVTISALARGLTTVKDAAEREARYQQFVAACDRLIGPDRAIELVSQPAVALLAAHPPTGQDLTAARSRLADVQKQIAQLNSETATPEDRAKARSLARDNLGLMGLLFIGSSEEEQVGTDQTESALDSELALLWWHGYPRVRWVPNELEWRDQQSLQRRQLRPPPTLMVTRLDGPSESAVRNIILTSAKIEKEGLKGQVAIDARGLEGHEPYADYDQKLRNLAGLLTSKTSLKITFDNTPKLIPAHSLQDIAIYCGWYSLRNYSPPGTFSPGAVGFHVASFELVTLRGVKEHGWVRGLLSDGVVGTLGPVAEPYLQSFPPADEFFPLLMTGKLTLAEAYWKTLPWGSWMQTCIGDPLYNPYKNDPPLKVEDLPPELRAAIPATQPAPTTQAAGG